MSTMTRPIAFNAATAAALEELRRSARLSGWSYSGVEKQDAAGEWTWTRGEARLTVGGWHGTGDWGSVKAFSTVYLSEPGEAIRSWDAPAYPSGRGPLPRVTTSGERVDGDDAVHYLRVALPALLAHAKDLLAGGKWVEPERYMVTFVGAGGLSQEQVEVQEHVRTLEETKGWCKRLGRAAALTNGAGFCVGVVTAAGEWRPGSDWRALV